MTERNTYELMKLIKKDNLEKFPGGFDEEPELMGSARDIIKWLLKHDSSVAKLTLSKRRER